MLCGDIISFEYVVVSEATHVQCALGNGSSSRRNDDEYQHGRGDSDAQQQQFGSRSQSVHGNVHWLVLYIK